MVCSWGGRRGAAKQAFWRRGLRAEGEAATEAPLWWPLVQALVVVVAPSCGKLRHKPAWRQHCRPRLPCAALLLGDHRFEQLRNFLLGATFFLSR